MKRTIIWDHTKNYKKATVFIADENGQLVLSMVFTMPKGLTKWERFCILKTDFSGRYLRKMKFNGVRPKNVTIKATAKAVKDRLEKEN